MLERLRILVAPRSEDKTAARRETLLCATAAGMAALTLLGTIISAIAILLGRRGAMGPLICSAAATLLCVLAFILGRRGRVVPAGLVLSLTAWACATSALALGAWESSAVAAYALAVVLGALFSGWLGGLLLSVLSSLSYGAVGSLLAGVPTRAAAMDAAALWAILSLGAVIVRWSARQAWALASADRDRMRKCADALEDAQDERQELIAQLQERTADHQRLLQTLDEISAPVLPLSEGLVVMPLAGHLSASRAERLLDHLLDGIDHYRAQCVLLDLTAMPTVDDDAVPGLLKAVQGARLLGSDCHLVGVRPRVASGLSALGADLAEIVSYSTLGEGLAALSGVPGRDESPRESEQA